MENTPTFLNMLLACFNWYIALISFTIALFIFFLALSGMFHHANLTGV